MASYSIIWKSSAEKDLRKIERQNIPRILEVVAALADDPFPPHHRKLRGGEGSLRIRIGDYSAVYQVDSEKETILIYHIRHRKDAYHGYKKIEFLLFRREYLGRVDDSIFSFNRFQQRHRTLAGSHFLVQNSGQMF
jgi:mRNA interferase RelE/StbE